LPEPGREPVAEAVPCVSEDLSFQLGTPLISFAVSAKSVYG